MATTIAWRSSNPIFAPANKRFRPESPLGESKDAFKPELQSRCVCRCSRAVVSRWVCGR